MTTTKIKLIMNHSNKLELFLHAELKVSSPINVCRAVGVIPTAETNHFSLSCHPHRSFIIYAKQLSTVLKSLMVCPSFVCQCSKAPCYMLGNSACTWGCQRLVYKCILIYKRYIKQLNLSAHLWWKHCDVPSMWYLTLVSIIPGIKRK